MLKVTVIFSLLMFSKAFNMFLVRTLAQVFRTGLLKVNDGELLGKKELFKLPQQRSGFSLLELKAKVRQSSYRDWRARGQCQDVRMV